MMSSQLQQMNNILIQTIWINFKNMTLNKRRQNNTFHGCQKYKEK